MCLQHPKFEVDLRVSADIGEFYRVWLGRIPLAAARADGSVRLHGAPSAVRGSAHWSAWSPMAPAGREAAPAQVS